mgnify:CR=1 FL=1
MAGISTPALGDLTVTPLGGTQDVNLIQVGGATFSLGQQLAASSLPVVLTASQLSTLTPLSTVAVTQSTSPWVVSLTSTTITGTVAVTQSTSHWIVQDNQDIMLGTDFSNVLGTSSLLITTQADDLVNTTDTIATSALGYVFDGTTWDRARGDSTDGLLVNLGTNNDVTVTGSVTANAGTNLNTSALLTSTNFSDAFGTAGVADSQVMSVQGIASMTPVQVSQATASNFNATVVGTGTFVVQATLAAETTKVIGVVRTADGSGNLLTSTSNALDVNLKTSSITITTKETRSSTSAVTQVGDSASSVTLLSANANRLGVSIINLSSAILYLKLGTTASATDCTAVLYQNGFWSDELYTGRVDAIWSADVGGSASITELTA